MVGISTDTSRYKSSLHLAKDAKDAGCTVVMGGPHVSYRDEEVLRTGLCDFVVREEGEQTMLELAGAIGTERMADVKGVSYLVDGKLQRNPERGFMPI